MMRGDVERYARWRYDGVVERWRAARARYCAKSDMIRHYAIRCLRHDICSAILYAPARGCH